MTSQAQSTIAPSRGKQKKIDATPAQRAQRLSTILSWRLQGCTLQKISENLPGAGFKRLAPSYISQLIRDALTKSVAEPLEAIRTLELMRLDELHAAFYSKALEGDSRAIGRVLALMDRRARLVGLNAPQKIEEVGDGAQAKRSLIAKLEALGAHLSISGDQAPPPPPKEQQPLATRDGSQTSKSVQPRRRVRPASKGP